MSNEDISNILQRLTSIETKQDNMTESLNQMKAGIGQRVETQGLEVAVLKSKMENTVNNGDFKVISDRVDSHNKIVLTISSVLILGIVGAILKLVLIK